MLSLCASSKECEVPRIEAHFSVNRMAGILCMSKTRQPSVIPRRIPEATFASDIDSFAHGAHIIRLGKIRSDLGHCGSRSDHLVDSTWGQTSINCLEGNSTQRTIASWGRKQATGRRESPFDGTIQTSLPARRRGKTKMLIIFTSLLWLSTVINRLGRGLCIVCAGQGRRHLYHVEIRRVIEASGRSLRHS